MVGKKVNVPLTLFLIPEKQLKWGVVCYEYKELYKTSLTSWFAGNWVRERKHKKRFHQASSRCRQMIEKQMFVLWCIIAHISVHMTHQHS